MAAVWHTLPGTIPVDGSTVYVRRWWMSTPFLGQWSLAAQTFTHASGLTLVWYRVARWKHVTEPPP